VYFIISLREWTDSNERGFTALTLVVHTARNWSCEATFMTTRNSTMGA